MCGGAREGDVEVIAEGWEHTIVVLPYSDTAIHGKCTACTASHRARRMANCRPPRLLGVRDGRLRLRLRWLASKYNLLQCYLDTMSVGMDLRRNKGMKVKEDGGSE
jgi:hypothetical protein